MANSDKQSQASKITMWALIALVVVVPLVLLLVRDARIKVLYQPEHERFVQGLVDNPEIKKTLRFVADSKESPDFELGYTSGTAANTLAGTPKLYSDNYPLFVNNLKSSFVPLALNPLLNFRIEGQTKSSNIEYSLSGGSDSNLLAFVIANSTKQAIWESAQSLADFNLLVQNPRSFDKRSFSVVTSDAISMYLAGGYNNLPIFYSQYRGEIEARDRVRFSVSALHKDREFALGLEVFGLVAREGTDQGKIAQLRKLFDSKDVSGLIAKLTNMMSANFAGPVTDEVELVARQTIGRSAYLVAQNPSALKNDRLTLASRALLAAPSDSKNIVKEFAASQSAK